MEFGSSHVGRLACYQLIADAIADRRVLELGCGDGIGSWRLAQMGAAHVLGLDSAAAVERARQRYRLANLEYRSDDPAAIEQDDGSFDCIIVMDGAAALRRSSVMAELHRVLRADGLMVWTVRSGDRASARGGVSFYELSDRLGALFAPIRVVAVAPLVGTVLAELEGSAFASTVELDTSLMMESDVDEDVVAYVALCGGDAAELALRYTLVQTPARVGVSEWASLLELDAAAPAEGEDAALRRQLEEALRDRLLALTEAERLRSELEDVEDTLVARDENQLAAMTAENAQLRARIAELEAKDEGPSASELISRALKEHARRVATLEDALAESQACVRELREELAASSGAAAADQVTELESKLERVTKNWRDAEAKSDEVWRRVGELQAELEAHREQAVVKSAEQRREAQKALARAMEEAQSKLVGVKNQLDREEQRSAELERQLEETREQQSDPSDAALPAASTESPPAAAGQNGAPMARIKHQLEVLSGDFRSDRELLAELQDGLTALGEASREALEAGDEEPRLVELASQLGVREAELTLLEVGLTASRERLRSLVADVLRTRAAIRDGEPTRAAALMDQLCDRLQPHEE